MKTEWPCKHVKEYRCNGENSNDEWVFTGDMGHFLGKMYSQPITCPVCGKDRPSKSKNLATILKENCVWTFEADYATGASSFRKEFSVPDWQTLAKACIEAVEEVIDERIQTRAPNSDWTRSLQDIKKAIRDTLL